MVIRPQKLNGKIFREKESILTGYKVPKQLIYFKFLTVQGGLKKILKLNCPKKY